MILRTTHRLIRIAGALGGGLFVLVLLAAWRLNAGPVEVHFLTPYLEAALKPDSGEYNISIGATELRWGGWDRSVDLTVTDVRGVDADGVTVATVPNLSIEISGPALLRGMIAPKRIRITSPTIRLFREPKSGYGLDFGRIEETDAAISNMTSRLFEELLEAPDRSRPLGHLTQLVIDDANLLVTDPSLDLFLSVPDSDILLERSASGLEIQVSTALALQGEQAVIDVVGGYREKDKVIDLAIGLSQARIGGIAAIWSRASEFGDTDLSVDGTVTLSVGIDGQMRTIGFDLHSGAGYLSLPAPVDHVFELDRMVARGRLTNGLDTLVVDEFSVVSGDAAAAIGLRATGIRNGTTDFAGNVAGRDIHYDRFDDLWPASIAPIVRDWVHRNLSRGRINEARLSLGGSVTGGDLVLDDLEGDLDLAGFTTGYLSGMPPVNKVDGTAKFTPTTFDITIDRGELGNLKVTGGQVDFSELDAEYPNTDIDINVSGPLGDVLALLESKPLGYASELGLDPALAKGDARIELAIDFPAKLALKLSEVEIHATADLTGVELPGLVGSHGIHSGDLFLDLDKEKMRIEGIAAIGEAPVSLSTERYFAQKAPFRWQYRVQAAIDAKDRKEFGLDFAPFSAPFLEGTVDADLLYTQLDGGRGTLVAGLDLRNAVMTLPGFGWAKGSGVAGQAKASLVFVNDRLAAIQSFEFTAAGMEAGGRVLFTESGDALNGIEFSHVRNGETDVTASVTVAEDGGFDIAISGKSFDASPLIGGDEDTGETLTAVATAPDKAPPAALPPIRISAEIDKVLLAPDRSVAEVRGFALREGGVWRSADLQGLVGANRETRLTLTPQNGFRRLEIVSSDAGTALRTLGIYDDMRNGQLKLVANLQNGEETSVKGGVEVQDFQIVNAPTFARVLSAPSVAGVINMAQGEGVNFARMQVPFQIEGKKATIEDARAFGSEIGLSATGTVDLERDRVDISGTLVPAYAVNSLIGQIPILGEIITGEKGGGLFAANYSLTGPLYDPKASVNPISALAPGFLRKFFDLFDGANTAIEPGQTTSQPVNPQDNK